MVVLARPAHSVITEGNSTVAREMVEWLGELVALTEDLGSICRTRWWLRTPVTLVPGDGCPFCIILRCLVVSRGLSFYVILFL